MISEIEQQLDALSAQFFERRKLPDAEIQRASQLCAEALAAGTDGMTVFWQFATALPPEATVVALTSAWAERSEAERQTILTRLQRLSDPVGKRLRLQLALSLRRNEPAAARRILTQWCASLTSGKNGGPSVKERQAFLSALISGKGPALLDFDFAEAIRAEVGPLLKCLETTVFWRPEGDSFTLQPHAASVTAWMWRQGLFAHWAPEQSEGAFAAIKRWPSQAKKELAGLIEPLPEPFAFLREMEVGSLELPPEPVSRAISENSDASKPSSSSLARPEPVRRETADEDPAIEKIVIPTRSPESNSSKQTSLSPHDLLKQLGEALRTFETEGHDARDKAQQSDIAARELRERIAVVQHDLTRAEERESTVRSQLDVERKSCRSAEENIRLLQTEIGSLKVALTHAREEHEREANTLSGRINVESARHLEAFRNTLADKVGLEWRDFQDVSGLPMSLEIGESHRRQLREIFALLAREGIAANH